MFSLRFLSLRLKKIYEELRKQKLDGFLITNQSNINYLTGFPSRESYLLINIASDLNKKIFFITDFRYWQEAKNNLALKNICFEMINGSVFYTIARLSKLLKIKRLGFEAKCISYAEYKEIKSRLPIYTEFIPTYNIIESFREIKSDIEIGKIKKAIEINIQTLNYAKKIIKPGLYEIEVAKILEDFIRKNGAKPAFETIVAGGINSCYPHHISNKYKLKKNDIVLIDIGVDFENYKSDLTRIFFLGKIPFIIKKIYRIVLEAQQIAIETIKSQVSINNIDKAARNYIKKNGFGEFFGHALGHGVGIDVHEEPYISLKNKNIIKNGMVFTLEPAIYLPKKFGIRIEDMVWFHNNKAVILSDTLDK